MVLSCTGGYHVIIQLINSELYFLVIKLVSPVNIFILIHL